MLLSYVSLDHGCVFTNEVVKEEIVVTLGTTLKISALEEWV